MNRILLTGYSGFIGREVLIKLRYRNVSLLGRSSLINIGNLKLFKGDINSKGDYSSPLIDSEVVIHCAARVNIMNDDSLNSLEMFREVNTFGTHNLAQQAADAGVKRFIFISSIKVNGESTEPGIPFKPDDHFIPSDPYALSKYEAEVGLQKIAKETGMEVVIIRPPLVYGPGVEANFLSMMKWVNKGVPLPLGAIKQNRRSLVSVDNLVDLIITCISHPNAANEIFLVSDDNDLSTTQLLTDMAKSLDVRRWLLPIPSLWFSIAAHLIGKPATSQRLCGSLQADISKTKELLDWRPPYSSAECMKKTADALIESTSSKNKLSR